MRHARASTPLRTLIQNRSLTRLHRRLLCSADLHPASRAAAAAASSSASAHTAPAAFVDDQFAPSAGPPLLSDFGAPWEDGYLAHKATEPGHWLDDPTLDPTASVEQPLLDVFGNEVRHCYGRLDEAYVVGAQSWREVLDRGPPAGMSDAEKLQWRQEVDELHSVDMAVEEYRNKFVQLGTTTSEEDGGGGGEAAKTGKKRLTTDEMLGRRLSQRQILGAQWFQLMAKDISHDLSLWALPKAERLPPPAAESANGAETAATAVERKKASPKSMAALLCNSIASPRNVALDAIDRVLGVEGPPPPEPQELLHAAKKGLTEEEQQRLLQQQQQQRAWQQQRLENMKEPVALAALLEAQRRVAALPRDAKPGAVRQALRMMGTNAEQPATEKAVVRNILRGYRTKLQKEQRRAEKKRMKQQQQARAAVAAGSEAGAPTEQAAASKAAASKAAASKAAASETEEAGPSEERQVLGDDMYLRFNAERSLETAYFALLRDRISTLSEQLSAMTISFVTSKVVAPEHVDGMRLDSACHGLTAAVAMQFTRDAIERHRQQRLHQRKQEAAFAEERAKELPQGQRVTRKEGSLLW